MRLNRFFSLCVCIFPLLASAQARHTVSGTIRDYSSGETLIGSSVVFLESPNVSAISNSYGFYSISAAPGKYTMVVSFSGYANDTAVVDLRKDTSISVMLQNAAKQLQEAVVVAGRNNNITKPLMGVQKLSISEIKDLPVLFGEKDILKTLQLLPGVQSAGDGNSGFYVRGGNPDQNLILLDEATVYNPSHLLGFFSTF
ncbi:MAG TPA: TonB-dependent receptor, partial [Puia sp.]